MARVMKEGTQRQVGIPLQTPYDRDMLPLFDEHQDEAELIYYLYMYTDTELPVFIMLRFISVCFSWVLSANSATSTVSVPAPAAVEHL